ncbi:3TM-type holin [Pararhodospirillum photometricum]|nr:3TM-type holin [Pararhodospirillum photometricum]
MMSLLLKGLLGSGRLALETLAAAESTAVESAPVSKGRYDATVNALNRLPRPALALGVLGILGWAPLDPEGFAQAMQAYALVPEWLAGTWFGVVAFYFTSRHFERRLELKSRGDAPPPPPAP